MSEARVLWLNEDHVRQLVSLPEVIEKLEAILPEEARGLAKNLPKTVIGWDPSSSQHALGAYSVNLKMAAFKTWVNTPNGATALVSLFDAETGALLGVFEAVTLGALRTAGIAGLATNLLAADDAHELALIGSGRQSLFQLAAVAAVRRLELVRVFSRSPDHRRRFVEQAQKVFPFDVIEASDLPTALKGAPIISIITRARDPVIMRSHVANGAHINAMGAVLPDNAELSLEMLKSAALIAVDSRENARLTSRELREYCGADESRWRSVQTLGEFIAGRATRPPNPRFTVFKSVGMGLSDLAVAAVLFERASARGSGDWFRSESLSSITWIQPSVRSGEKR